MAKLTGPLLSLGARGQIGKTLVASSWRGISTARQYVIPANPRTTAQQTNRTRFAFLREMWKRASTNTQAAFNAYAEGRKFLGFNAFVGENNRLMVGDTDLSALEGSPGAGGGLSPEGLTVGTGSSTGEVDVTLDAPAQLPDGWTIVSAQAMGVVDQDPTGIFTGHVASGEDLTDPYEITLDGFDASADVRVVAWFVYTKSNGKTAYSVSMNDAATAAA